jgi:CTP:molybdopterin cytidylyltransferase MocA
LYGDAIAPPALYAAALYPELRATDSGKQVIQHHRAEAIEMICEPGALADLDFPADVESARRLLKD